MNNQRGAGSRAPVPLELVTSGAKRPPDGKHPHGGHLGIDHLHRDLSIRLGEAEANPGRLGVLLTWREAVGDLDGVDYVVPPAQLAGDEQGGDATDE